MMIYSPYKVRSTLYCIKFNKSNHIINTVAGFVPVAAGVGGEGEILLGDGGRKLVLVLVDGMRDDTARERLGFIEGLVDQGRGLRAHAQSVLPSLSRPCYEAICTGTQPVENGVTSNDTVRLSTQTSIFDVLLARLLPGWLREGYDVVVTADHGMDEFGLHGGPDDGVRRVPLYLFSSLLAKGGAEIGQTIAQTSLAALFCRLLGVSPADTMQPLPVDIERDWFSR